MNKTIKLSKPNFALLSINKKRKLLFSVYKYNERNKKI